METIKNKAMRKSENKVHEVAFRRTMKKEDEPIQLSRENILFKRTVKSAKTIPFEDLFIVPWQQSHEYK